VADEFIVFCRSGCGEPCDPRVNPSNGIRDIRAIDRNLMADEEIFRDIFFDPSGEIRFFLIRPTLFAHFPDLMGRFYNRFTKSRHADQEKQKERQRFHKIILKRLKKDCQLKENGVF